MVQVCGGGDAPAPHHGGCRRRLRTDDGSELLAWIAATDPTTLSSANWVSRSGKRGKKAAPPRHHVNTRQAARTGRTNTARAKAYDWLEEGE